MVLLLRRRFVLVTYYGCSAPLVLLSHF
uniref:Uncharacterized protein n=1 Tax=Rhizophora mucronata TaxID=61149 RepID=A0A2P2J0Y9_RHIMU